MAWPKPQHDSSVPFAQTEETTGGSPKRSSKKRSRMRAAIGTILAAYRATAVPKALETVGSGKHKVCTREVEWALRIMS